MLLALIGNQDHMDHDQSVLISLKW